MTERDLYIWAEERPNHVTLRDFLAIGFRQRRLMVTTFIALLGAVVGIALVLPKQYEAQMKILVRHERVDSVISAERETPRQTQTEVTEGELESEAELLKSKDLLAKVVIACNLDKEIDFSFLLRCYHQNPITDSIIRMYDSDKTHMINQLVAVFSNDIY